MKNLPFDYLYRNHSSDYWFSLNSLPKSSILFDRSSSRVYLDVQLCLHFHIYVLFVIVQRKVYLVYFAFESNPFVSQLHCDDIPRFKESVPSTCWSFYSMDVAVACGGRKENKIALTIINVDLLLSAAVVVVTVVFFWLLLPTAGSSIVVVLAGATRCWWSHGHGWRQPVCIHLSGFYLTITHRRSSSPLTSLLLLLSLLRSIPFTLALNRLLPHLFAGRSMGHKHDHQSDAWIIVTSNWSNRIIPSSSIRIDSLATSVTQYNQPTDEATLEENIDQKQNSEVNTSRTNNQQEWKNIGETTRWRDC